MRVEENKNSIRHLAVLTGLWFVNILIVIFGSPFLIYKKLHGLFFKKADKFPPAETKPKSAQYFPCGINSKW